MYPAGVSIMVALLNVALDAVLDVWFVVVTLIDPPVIATFELLKLANVHIPFAFTPPRVTLAVPPL
jgi:hypothetical protein